MTQSFPAHLTALTLATVLALGSLAPAPARADDRPQSPGMSQDTAQLLFFGLAAVALIAHLNTRNDDKDDDDDRAAAPRADRPDRTIAPRIEVPRADPRVMPAHCLKRVRTHDRPVRLYMRHCLHVAGVSVHHLPQACDRRVRETDGNPRRGFAPRCLGRHGYHLPR